MWKHVYVCHVGTLCAKHAWNFPIIALDAADQSRI